MAAEILPSGATPYDETTEKQWTPDSGERTVYRYSGEASALEALYETRKGAAALLGSGIGSLALSSSRGRATLAETRVRMMTEGTPDDEQGQQELYAETVVRPIWLAPYFSITATALTIAETAAVRKRFEDTDETAPDSGWNTKQKQLWGHLICGQESYNATAYRLRITFRVTSASDLRRAMTGINMIATLPTLTGALEKLVSDNLRDSGEWIKLPTQIAANPANGGYTVAEEYLWQAQWSVVYGGTFTGV